MILVGNFIIWVAWLDADSFNQILRVAMLCMYCWSRKFYLQFSNSSIFHDSKPEVNLLLGQLVEIFTSNNFAVTDTYTSKFRPEAVFSANERDSFV